MKRDDRADAVRYKVWEIIPTLGGGGAEKMVLDLADGLNNSTYEPTVISLYDKEYATTGRLRFAEENGLTVEYLHKKSGFDIRILFRLAKLIKSEKPDIIHTHIGAFPYVAILGFFLRFTHIHTVHTIAGLEPRLHQWLLRSSGKHRKTHFVVLSDTILTSMQELYNIPKQYLHCIKNGVDIDGFAYRERTLPADPIRFLTVGSLIPVKNQTLLLKVFATLEEQRGPKDYLTIVGDGELRNELKNKAQELGISGRVAFTGTVEDVLPYLYHSDVFVMTSHYEGVSLALLEAAATGLPLIVSATGGTPELVGENALMFEDDTESQLISAIIRVTDDAALYASLSVKSRSLAEAHSKQKMINQYADLYDTAREQKSGKALTHFFTK